jgi:hypothetical protein
VVTLQTEARRRRELLQLVPQETPADEQAAPGRSLPGASQRTPAAEPQVALERKMSALQQ